MKDKARDAILVHLSVASFYLLHGTETAVMVVTTIDWHQICEVTEEECSVGKQLDLVVRGRSVGENDRDASTGLTVCFEEATLSVVDNDVTDFGKGSRYGADGKSPERRFRASTGVASSVTRELG